MLKQFEVQNLINSYHAYDKAKAIVKQYCTGLLDLLAHRYSNKIDSNFYSIQYYTIQDNVISLHPIDKFGNYYKVYSFPLNLFCSTDLVLKYLEDQIKKEI